MNRDVRFTKKALKQVKDLPKKVKESLARLVKEIEIEGPIRGNWANYSKLTNTKHHCHLKKGRPTYVVCWEEVDNKILIEVYYVGTHEKAPY